MSKEKLQKIKINKAKRVGRGPGSGKGKTAGKGTKGQRARHRLSITHPHYEGGQRSIFKRLPYRRGKGNAKISIKPIVINLEIFNSLPKKQLIDLESLIKFSIVKKEDAQKYGVKVLGDGKLTNPVIIKVPISKKAAKKVTDVGGKVEIK